MARSKQFGARPSLACEITPDRVITARASKNAQQLEMITSRRLTEGALKPAMTGTNVLDRTALTNAINSALAAVAGNSRDVIAIVPDAAVRVLLLEFETLPAKPQDAEAVVRFRLKKALPFDVEQAALSYEARRVGQSVQVVAAISPKEVVAEYEAAFLAAGYSPGVLLPSSLAALGMIEGETPTLMLKVDPLSITVAAAEHQELRLMRTLDNPHGESVSATELAEAVLPSIMFFEDTFGARIERIFISGVASILEVGPMLHEHTGAHVEELAPIISSGQILSGDNFPASMMAGVAGALLG
jgi:type IV pilus assembly protein PilM